MKSLALENFPFVHLTATALLLFFVVFVGVVWWANRKGARHLHRRIEQLPLE